MLNVVLLNVAAPHGGCIKGPILTCLLNVALLNVILLNVTAPHGSCKESDSILSHPVLQNYQGHMALNLRKPLAGNTKGGSITVPLTSYWTGLESAI